LRASVTDQRPDIQSTMGARKMGKLALGCAISLAIGAMCRWVDPLPSPPKIQGALLVVAMTLGYLATDWVIAREIPSRGPATTQSLCGGPTGVPCAPKGPRKQ
jgi:XapX domain-containing protein